MSVLKKRVYEIVAEPPPGDKVGEAFSIGILTLITVNVVVGIFETVPSLAQSHPDFFYWFEFFSVIVFTIEYLLRLWSCTSSEEYAGFFRGRLKAALTPMAIIDFVAIVPFYLAAFVTIDLRFVRILRLFRLFRLFRSGKLADSFTTLVMVIKSKKEELGLSLMVLMLVLVLSSSVMFMVEQDQPDTQFTSVPASMWWGMMTITTIGYGDMYPMTTLGRIVGSIVGFLGICVFALPVGIMGAGFTEYMEKKRSEENEEGSVVPASEATRCPHCGQHVK